MTNGAAFRPPARFSGTSEVKAEASAADVAGSASGFRSPAGGSWRLGDRAHWRPTLRICRPAGRFVYVPSSWPPALDLHHVSRRAHPNGSSPCRARRTNADADSRGAPQPSQLDGEWLALFGCRRTVRAGVADHAARIAAVVTKSEVPQPIAALQIR